MQLRQCIMRVVGGLIGSLSLASLSLYSSWPSIDPLAALIPLLLYLHYVFSGRLYLIPPLSLATTIVSFQVTVSYLSRLGEPGAVGELVSSIGLGVSLSLLVYSIRGLVVVEGWRRVRVECGS